MKLSLRSWLWRVPVDEEVEEEIAFHVDMRTRELVDRGMDPETARQAAIGRLGDLASLKRTCVDLGRKRDRAMRLSQWFDELRDDVRFGLRQLRRSPAFTFVVVLTLALGIGANSAIFALVDATLLRPLPFQDPERLVMLSERTATAPGSWVSPLNFLDWRDRSRSFEAMGASFPGVGGMVMSGADGVAETVPRQWVTAGFFHVLGVRPIVGRTFAPADDEQRASVVVLSEGFWRTRFNADPGVIGRSIRLDGDPYTVIGVVPKDFQLLGRTSMWALVPIARDPSRDPQLRSFHVLRVVGRLKPNVTLDAARSDLSAVAEGLAREFPKTNIGRGVVLEPLHEALIGSELRLTSMLFLGVVGFVLLICCANVANLLLARGTGRARELATRSALGAGRGRVIRQLLTESTVLAVLGGALGVAVGAGILNAARPFIPEGLLPASVTLAFDARVIASCAAAALFVGLLFGLVPAWQATELSLARAIGSDGRATTRPGGIIRGVLVAAQVATAVLLLFGAGLLLRTLVAVTTFDRGYRAESVLTMMVDPLGARYPTDTSLVQFFDAVEQEIMAVPGVRSVGWTSALPLGGSETGPYFFEIMGEPYPDESKRPTAEYQIVSPGYFRTLLLPVVAGRGFDKRDTTDGAAICMVNEAFVRAHVRGRSPIGMRVTLRSAGSSQARSITREIVGVVRQVKSRPDETADLLRVYVPLAQHPLDDIYLAVQPASGPASALASSVRAAIGRVDREQLVSVRDVMTLDDVAWQATSRHRFRALLVMTFAGLALVLAMVGVFGIVAYSVQERTRDFGVRRALGAGSGDVVRLALGGAVRVIAVGAVIGLVLSSLLGQLLATVLFGVKPLDPVTFGAVTIVLAFTAALSTAGPAWRATRIDPAVALRAD